jgi:membrane protease YdiL (CAAX protease family)
MAKVSIKFLKHAILYYSYLLVVWGFYRLLFQAPMPLEELIVKPVVWLLPLYFLAKQEKLKLESLGVTSKNFFGVVYSVLALGVVFTVFALLVNYLKYRGFNFGANVGEGAFLGAIILSFITAFSEELAFRGYLLSHLQKVVKSQWTMNIVLSVGWTLIHLPIAVLDWRMETSSVLVYLVLVFTFSIGATFVYLRTKNIMAPILLHVLWQWPIILFR